MMPHAMASCSATGKRRDRDGRLVLQVGADHVLEIHPVELVAGEDQHQVVVALGEIGDIAPDGVGGPLVPRLVLHRLLGGQDLDESAAERIELVRVVDVPVQADGVELGQHEDPVQPGVNAVGHGDVDQPIFAGDRHGRLAPRFGQRKQPRAATAAQDQRDDPRHDTPPPMVPARSPARSSHVRLDHLARALEIGPRRLHVEPHGVQLVALGFRQAVASRRAGSPSTWMPSSFLEITQASRGRWLTRMISSIG